MLALVHCGWDDVNDVALSSCVQETLAIEDSQPAESREGESIKPGTGDEDHLSSQPSPKEGLRTNGSGTSHAAVGSSDFYRLSNLSKRVLMSYASGNSDGGNTAPSRASAESSHPTPRSGYSYLKKWHMSSWLDKSSQQAFHTLSRCVAMTVLMSQEVGAICICSPSPKEKQDLPLASRDWEVGWGRVENKP